MLKRACAWTLTAGLALAGLTGGSAFAQPDGPPISPRTDFKGCMEHRLEESNRRAWVRGCGGPGINEFRASAECNTGNYVYGSWVPSVANAWSRTGLCWTGIRTVRHPVTGELQYRIGWDER